MSTKLSSDEVMHFVRDNDKKCDGCRRYHRILCFAHGDMNNAFGTIRRFPNSEKAKAKVVDMRDKLREARESARSHIEDDH